MPTKTSAELTLFDRLSRLTFAKAAKLLGADGPRLIGAGGKYEIDIDAQVELRHDAFRLALGTATVTLTLDPASHRDTARRGGTGKARTFAGGAARRQVARMLGRSRPVVAR